ADGFCAWAPMFHMASADHLLATLMSGGPVIVVDGMQPGAIAEAAARFPLGWLVLMPGAIAPMIAELAARPIAPVGIRAIGAMADLVPAHELAEITRLLRAPYLNSFGATETGLPPASAALIPPGTVPRSLSKRQSALCALRLLDEEGNEVADGQTGEMAIRGPTVFSGYWNAEETNRRDFADGYFRMGDLFRRNPEGDFDFVDSAKYMIKSGGENIYPAEIERVLLADPRIAEAVVVRRRDPRWGEIPRAFVVRRDPSLTAADIESLCRARLAGYKRPRDVVFVAMESLPRSTTGKIQRHELERSEPPDGSVQ
ncbi:MAG: long-chain fatty acid--CoA ligase, partial [Rhodospirillales bacterium]|nr:long-chain fatty acid--CoA ligase [Rhodospirillales bacterium]